MVPEPPQLTHWTHVAPFINYVIHVSEESNSSHKQTRIRLVTEQGTEQGFLIPNF